VGPACQPAASLLGSVWGIATEQPRSTPGQALPVGQILPVYSMSGGQIRNVGCNSQDTRASLTIDRIQASSGKGH
jgi:hypothetical protein